VPGDVVVVDHHDPEAVVDEPLKGGQLLLLNLIVVDGFKGDTPMAPSVTQALRMFLSTKLWTVPTES